MIIEKVYNQEMFCKLAYYLTENTQTIKQKINEFSPLCVDKVLKNTEGIKANDVIKFSNNIQNLNNDILQAIIKYKKALAEDQKREEEKQKQAYFEIREAERIRKEYEKQAKEEIKIEQLKKQDTQIKISCIIGTIIYMATIIYAIFGK